VPTRRGAQCPTSIQRINTQGRTRRTTWTCFSPAKGCGGLCPRASGTHGGGQDPTSNWCTTGGSLRQKRSRTLAGSTRGLPRLPTGDPSLPYAWINHGGGTQLEQRDFYAGCMVVDGDD
jgi:hypothetical protein